MDRQRWTKYIEVSSNVAVLVGSQTRIVDAAWPRVAREKPQRRAVAESRDGDSLQRSDLSGSRSRSRQDDCRFVKIPR
jgi:hypothetical protein